MALKKEVHVKIEGDYLKGSIVGKIYKSNTLIDTKTLKRFERENEYDVLKLKKIIGELQELVETMDGVQVADALTDDDSDPLF